MLKDNNIKFRPLDNPAYQRSLEEIYDDLNDIFEGAKVEELGNEEWRVTTPNGKRIIVKVADRIILNDKQSANMRKAHNLDSDYIAEASGYWRAISENDVDGELVISGSGAMKNYGSSNVPWYSYRSAIQKVIIENGVTTVGRNAFYSCKKGHIVLNYICRTQHSCDLWGVSSKVRRGIYGSTYNRIDRGQQ